MSKLQKTKLIVQNPINGKFYDVAPLFQAIALYDDDETFTGVANLLERGLDAILPFLLNQSVGLGDSINDDPPRCIEFTQMIEYTSALKKAFREIDSSKH